MHIQTVRITPRSVRLTYPMFGPAPTGPKSGLWILDVDPKSGGTESLENLVGTFGALPETPQVVTGSGGTHLYFRHPSGNALGNTSGRLGSGLDTRSHNGYCVAPPSRHASGGEYTWEWSSGPDTIPLAAIPTWLLSLLAEPPQPEAKAPTASGGETEPPGNGNVKAAFLAMLKLPIRSDEADGSGRLLAAARQCVRYGLSEPEALAMIRAYATANPFPREFSDSEIRQRLKDAAKRTAPGAALTVEPTPPTAVAVPPYRPFPVDVLPSPMRDFVEAAAAAIGCDPAFIALPCLAAAGAAIGNTRCVRLKRSWTEPAVIWTATVAESGCKKTPSMAAALRPIHDMERRARDEHSRAMVEYNNALMRAKGDKSKPPDPPVCQRFMASDITVEGAAVVLDDTPRGFLLARDELSGMFGLLDAYKKNGARADAAHWLSMWGAGPIHVDRKTSERRSIYVPHAAVSITGTIQPGILARVLGTEHFEDGFAARFLLAMPDRRIARWSEADIRPDVSDAWRDTAEELAALDFAYDPKTGRAYPRPVGLSVEGKAAWIRFYDEHAEKQAELAGDLAAMWSKLEAYVARLALIVHLIRHVNNDPTLQNPDQIDAQSIGVGVALVRWFGCEAERVYAGLAESDETRDQKTVISWIVARGGETTVNALAHGPRRFRGSAEAAHSYLDELARSGKGIWVYPPPGKRGGHPVKSFRLTPSGTTTPTLDLANGGSSTRATRGEGDDALICDTPEPSPDPEEYAPEGDVPEGPEDTDSPPPWSDGEIPADLIAEGALDL